MTILKDMAEDLIVIIFAFDVRTQTAGLIPETRVYVANQNQIMETVSGLVSAFYTTLTDIEEKDPSPFIFFIAIDFLEKCNEYKKGLLVGIASWLELCINEQKANFEKRKADFWNKNPAYKQKIEQERRDIDQKIKDLEEQINTLQATKEWERYREQIKQAWAEHEKISVFKMKERKLLRDKIEEFETLAGATHRLSEDGKVRLNEEIDAQRKRLQEIEKAL